MTVTRRRWRDLPRGDRRAALVMAALVPLLHISVRVLDYQRTNRWLADRTPAPDTRRPPADALNRWVTATTRVQAYSPCPGNCLSRSLALWWMLRRDGVDATLQLGVSLAGRFAAHAWVEANGQVLNDTQDVTTRYTPMHASR
jgi:hypothetical protein